MTRSISRPSPLEQAADPRKGATAHRKRRTTPVMWDNAAPTAPTRSVKRRWEPVKGCLTAFKGPLNEVKGCLTAFKRPMNEVKGCLTAFKRPMNDVKGRMTAFKQPMNEVKGRLTAFKQPMNEVKGRMTAFKRPMNAIASLSTERATDPTRRVYFLGPS